MSKADLMLEIPGLLDCQKALLDQRLQDAEAHPEDWVSWDEAKQRLERGLAHQGIAASQ